VKAASPLSSPGHPVRRLPLFVSPAEGESFSSYVDRLASELAVPVSVLLSATGVLDGHSLRPRLPAYGLALPPERLVSFASATGLDRERVRQMQLGAYAGVAFDVRVLPMNGVQTRRLPSREWVYMSGSHACPRCLAERPVWQLAWRLPWSFACAHHQCLLVDTCPSCGGRTGPRPDQEPARIAASRARAP